MCSKHIVHLTSVHNPLDTRIIKECRSLVQAGYSVTLVGPCDQDDVVDGVRIIAVRPASRLRRMTVTVLQVYRLALTLDADLYQFHDPELIPIGLALQLRGKRVIYDIHEDVPRSLLGHEYLPSLMRPILGWLMEHLENFAGPRFSALVTATPVIEARFQVLNPRTITVNNYPWRDELCPVAPITWQERAPAVAYVGTISLPRGILEMVKAMEFVTRPSSEAVLELVGTFAYPENRQRAKQLNGWAHVRECGRLDRIELARLLGRVSAGLVVIHPTPAYSMSQPTKLFEYMSASIPVICSDFPMWRKYIEEDKCGLLVDPLNPEAISFSIEYLLTHPEEAEEMGRRGREAVEKKYNWELERDKLLRLYADLLSG